MGARKRMPVKKCFVGSLADPGLSWDGNALRMELFRMAFGACGNLCPGEK